MFFNFFFKRIFFTLGTMLVRLLSHEDKVGVGTMLVKLSSHEGKVGISSGVVLLRTLIGDSLV